MQTFSVHWALSCSNGGLVTAHHNDICDEIIYLSRQAFYPHYVRGEPLIHLGFIRSEDEVSCEGSVPETWGAMSIRGLWGNQTEEIIDARFGDADAENWKPEGIDKLLY